MLKKLYEKKTTRDDVDFTDITLTIKDAKWPAPYGFELEYSAPARGTWNIVHSGMNVPEAHEIYVCAAGCLRGVVLTAAEMNAIDRFSTVEVREENLFDGSLEDLAINGVDDILERLPYKPRAVMVHTNCLHHFAGCDIDVIQNAIKEHHPDIDFIDAYMNPIMRKSGLTPDQLMRSRIMLLLNKRPLNKKAIAIVGNDLATRKESDFYQFLLSTGLRIHEITDAKTYDEYQEMAESSYYLTSYPSACAGADMLAEKLGGKHLPLKFSFNYEEIRQMYETLSIELKDTGADITLPDFTSYEAKCDKALDDLKKLIGDTEISIDYTYCVRPLGLAKLLLKKGFNVKTIYLDAYNGADKPDYDYLVEHHPELTIMPTINVKMRYFVKEAGRDALAIGQKAAFFENTKHFVNAIQNDGMLGYNTILQTVAHIEEAYKNEKEIMENIRQKGLGCESCI